MNNKKLRIAIIGTPVYPIPAVKGGAIETLTTALIMENEKYHNFDFVVITTEDENLSYYRNLLHYTQILQIPKSGKLISALEFCYKVIRKLFCYRILPWNNFMYKINKILDANDFDIILFESTINELLQLRNKKKAKVLYHVHSDYINNNTIGIKSFVNKIDYIITVSEFIKDRAISSKYLEKEKIITLLNAVNVENISNTEKILNRTSIRKRFNVLPEETLIIYCSRLSPEKGILELIKAVKTLDKGKLMIVGGANFSSSKKTSYVSLLETEVKGFENRIFFTGYIKHEDVFNYMMAADIAVVPSICNEAASLTLLEFRAAGLCTIANKRGGIPEYCNEKSTLLINENNDFINNLANALTLLVNNSALRNKYAICAKDGLEKFTYSSYYTRFTSIIEKIIYL